MSRGIGAYAKKIVEDDETVIFEYGGYNLNEPEYRNENYVLDGMITIQKSCFVEPEIHKKLKKMPSGWKKLMTKRIPVSVDYTQLLKDGKIIIENCSFCWNITDDELKADMMACHILFKLFYQYQEEGSIPSVISYNV
mgnify:CR=1 FL=1